MCQVCRALKMHNKCSVWLQPCAAGGNIQDILAGFDRFLAKISGNDWPFVLNTTCDRYMIESSCTFCYSCIFLHLRVRCSSMWSIPSSSRYLLDMRCTR